MILICASPFNIVETIRSSRCPGICIPASSHAAICNKHDADGDLIHLCLADCKVELRCASPHRLDLNYSRDLRIENLEASAHREAPPRHVFCRRYCSCCPSLLGRLCCPCEARRPLRKTCFVLLHQSSLARGGIDGGHVVSSLLFVMNRPFSGW